MILFIPKLSEIQCRNSNFQKYLLFDIHLPNPLKDFSNETNNVFYLNYKPIKSHDKKCYSMQHAVMASKSSIWGEGRGLKPWVEGITKIKVHGPITKCNPDLGKDLPEIQWRNWGETRGGHYEKRKALQDSFQCITYIKGRMKPPLKPDGQSTFWPFLL